MNVFPLHIDANLVSSHRKTIPAGGDYNDLFVATRREGANEHQFSMKVALCEHGIFLSVLATDLVDGVEKLFSADYSTDGTFECVAFSDVPPEELGYSITMIGASDAGEKAPAPAAKSTVHSIGKDDKKKIVALFKTYRTATNRYNTAYDAVRAEEQRHDAVSASEQAREGVSYQHGRNSRVRTSLTALRNVERKRGETMQSNRAVLISTRDAIYEILDRLGIEQDEARTVATQVGVDLPPLRG